MKIIRADKLKFSPASHEPADKPGALKKILISVDNLPNGRIRMINWAKIPPKKAFANHYHEDLTEVFIILKGRAEITVDQEKAILKRGDAVVIPAKASHIMKNLGAKELVYLALGVSRQGQGKTIVV